MEVIRDQDSMIRVRRTCGWQVGWLAGLLNIPKGQVVELAMNEFIEAHAEELGERTNKMLNVQHQTISASAGQSLGRRSS